MKRFLRSDLENTELKPWEHPESEEDWDTEEQEDEVESDDSQAHEPLRQQFVRPPQTAGGFLNLPVELVGHILDLACPHSSDEKSYARAVNQVMSVCTLFNDVILGKPEFWKCIVIPPYDRPIDHIPLYIQRSKALSLDIIIHLSPDDSLYNRRQKFKARTGTLFGVADRWRTLQIVMDAPWRDVTSVLPPSLPGLESLEITSRSAQSLDHPALSIRTLVPKLSSLKVNRARLDLLSLRSERELDVLHLCGLSLNTAKWFACFAFVRSCTRLRTLHFSAIVSRAVGTALPDNLHQDQEIALQLLQTLDITTNASSAAMRHLLQIIEAPNLRSLSIGQLNPYTAAISSSGWTFEGLQLRFPLLERLALQRIFGSEDVVRSCLQALPTITHLAVLPHDHMTLLRLHLTDSSGDIFCPHLRVLVTKFVPPRVLRSALKPYASAGIRLGLWVHVDDIALSGLSDEFAFEELKRDVDWLRSSFDVRTTGAASTALYRSWEAVRSRSWRAHQELGADVQEIEGWDLRL
ncbi:hypothetical protein FRB90_011152 [Tulasnella sp. 427]|nr:hypothetical protein FRB90_011152 [Tulasnella sp. 427]